MIFGALISQSFIVILFLILSINDVLGVYGFIVMLFLFLACLGISNPNTAWLTLARFFRNAGSDSASMVAIQLGFGAFVSFAVGIFVAISVVPLVIIMSSTTPLALKILILGRRKIKKFMLMAFITRPKQLFDATNVS